MTLIDNNVNIPNWKKAANIFEKYNLISGLHSFYSKKDHYYKNILPPLSILNSQDEQELFGNLDKINFSIKSLMAA